MNLEQVTNSLHSCIDELSASSKPPDARRQKLLDACNRLKAALESPIDILTRIMYGPFETTAVRVCINMGIFNELTSSNGNPLSADELASRLNADALLIVRFMRIITAMGLAKELSEKTYAALPITGLLADRSPLVGAVRHLGPTTDAVMKLPAYFEAKGYSNPANEKDGPFQYALDTHQHFFDWTHSHPKQQAAFQAVMGMSARNRGQDWYGYYPVEQRLVSDDPDRPLLVDIGGGAGQNLAALVEKHPSFGNRVVLQDLPSVIADVEQPLQDIRAMAHDFFDPQPVRAAKAYYMRTVLHDWPNASALNILKNTRDAMTEDSILLVNEQILPEDGVSLLAADGDIVMMTQFASLERTHRQWLELLDLAGFEVIQTWYPTQKESGERALFEAKIKGS